MKTAHHRFAVAILALLVLPVPAWGADPIKSKLDRARKTYAKKIAVATSTHLKAFDVKIKKAARKGDLESYKALQAEKEKILEGRTLPNWHPLHKHQVAYKKDQLAAMKQLAEAMGLAIKKYTMKREIVKAEEVQRESAAMLKEINRVVTQEGIDIAIRLPARYVKNDNREVIRLWISPRSKITDASLVDLKKLTKLEYLRISNNGITDAGLKHLKGLTNLKELILWQEEGTEVTRAGINKLQQALPNCKIVWRLAPF